MVQKRRHLLNSLLKQEVCSVRKIFAPYDNGHHYNTLNRLYIIAVDLNLTINFLAVSCLKNRYVFEDIDEYRID